MEPLTCPSCSSAHVIKHARNPSGTTRYLCRSCGKTFSPQRKSQALTAEKEEQILAALSERISQRGIARMLKVGRQTLRAVRQKGPSG